VQRPITHYEHSLLAMDHLGLIPFSRDHMESAAAIAAEAAFATDHGARILTVLIETLREHKLVLPSVNTLERLAIKGRAAPGGKRRPRSVTRWRAANGSIFKNSLTMILGLASRASSGCGYPLSVSPASLKDIVARRKRRLAKEIEADGISLKDHSRSEGK